MLKPSSYVSNKGYGTAYVLDHSQQEIHATRMFTQWIMVEIPSPCVYSWDMCEMCRHYASLIEEIDFDLLGWVET